MTIRIPIGDIPGFRIGHAQDEAGATGCTVILCGDGAAAGQGSEDLAHSPISSRSTSTGSFGTRRSSHKPFASCRVSVSCVQQ